MSWLDMPTPRWCDEHDERLDECGCLELAESMKEEQDEQWGVDRMRGET